MRAVILAGGRGSRFGELTKIVPKPLIHVGGKELIRHVMDTLPKSVTECIVVVGYLGHLIKSRFGNSYGDLGLLYVSQDELGTGGALRSVRNVLRKGEIFLVVGSDDIFGPGELDKLLSTTYPSYGIYFGIQGKITSRKLLFDRDMYFLGFDDTGEPGKPRYFGVGAYVLPEDVFQYDFVCLENGELSIPHTLARVSFPVLVVPIMNWMPVNNLAERKAAELFLT